MTRNILLAINTRWWNAEAAYALNLATGLMAEGKDVLVIVNPDSPAFQKAEQLQIPVTSDILLDSISPATHARNYRRLIQLVQAENIQLINSFKSNGAFLFSLIRKKFPDVLYIKTRGEARPPRDDFMNRILYGPRGCDGVITVGEQVHQWVTRITPREHLVKTVYYGAESLESERIANRNHVLERLNIPSTARILALVGRTQKVKGHMPLVQALARINDESAILLFLVKDLDEFPQELTEIHSFIQANQLEERVKILGFQERLSEILSIVDLGVIPSLASEVNCRVAVEFFSIGVPVIAFPTGTLVDIMRHKYNGYLCGDRTVESLTKGINWMLADDERRRRIGVAGKRNFQSNYTIKKMARDTLEFYDACAEKASR